ncbi:MAG: hypothetical protein KO202_06160 [Methanobacteriaceae archaeon]|nr:hypothetical protein [Methanobacteriaceae archaeon]
MTTNVDIDEKEGKKFFSKIGFIFLGLTIFTIFCQIIMRELLLVFPVNLTGNVEFNMILSAVINYIIPLPLFLYVMSLGQICILFFESCSRRLHLGFRILSNL